MIMIDPETGWFKNVEVPCFNLEEIAKLNIEYMEKYSESISRMFNNTWLCK